MEELFQDFNLEIMVDNVHFDVEKVQMDAQSKRLFIISSYVDKHEPHSVELIINDIFNIYAMKLKAIEYRNEAEKKVIVCQLPPLNYNFFRRLHLRLITHIPVEYVFLHAKPDGELDALTSDCKGIISNISPFGASIEVEAEHMTIIKDFQQTPLYVKLNFKLPSQKEDVAEVMEFIGKIVNVKKVKNVYHIGVLFLAKSFSQFHAIEYYCKQLANNQEEKAEEQKDMMAYVLECLNKPY